MTQTTSLTITPTHSWVWMASIALFVVSIFLAAVFVAGWTVNTAYQSAHLQQREKIALAKRKVLQEQLAQASSLSVALQYAEKEGFVPTVLAGTLDVSTPVAQSSIVR